ncbi:hypothetical protein [Haladaptatus sp. DJG-WS-42]|uniref:hypothetical protein n=1 Tax=Haladaptatus sp. DJG-WS-42 TaxID=3120516 RepID=UPI0030CB2F6A
MNHLRLLFVLFLLYAALAVAFFIDQNTIQAGVAALAAVGSLSLLLWYVKNSESATAST